LPDFNSQGLRDFLLAMDVRLSGKHRLIIFGGAAIALQYLTSHATSDIEIVLDVSEQVRHETGLEVAFEDRGGSFYPPESYEERLTIVNIEGLNHMEVLVPERHDLALSKIVRCETRDIEALRDMHVVEPFDRNILVERFRETAFFMEKKKAEGYFLIAIDKLFGSEAASQVEEQFKQG
jgi:hypothetical protein